jgi:hypothetical protein
MKRPLVVTVGVLLLVLAVAILSYLFQPRREQSSGESGHSERNSGAPSPAVPGGTQEALTHGDAKPSSLPSPWTPTAEELRRIEETEAVFYGRVIDQYGEPVTNVKIRFTPADQGRNGLYQTWFVQADSKGAFAIRRKNTPAVRISVEVPPGYYGTNERGGEFAFPETPVSLPPALRKNLLPPHRADPANPVIFKLKKMGPTEPLIYWRQSRVLGEENTFQVAPDPGHRLLLKFWVDPVPKRSDPISQMPFYDWGCEISVPSGGIVARTNPEAFDAPVDGYTDQIRFDYPAEMDARDYKLGLNREFFLKFDDGRFARIEVSMDSRPQRPFATVVSWFNPSGSRSTEFDESKQIEIPAPR